MAKDFKKSIQSAGLGALIPTSKSEEDENIQKLRKAAAAAKAAKKIGAKGRPARTDKNNKTASSAERGTKPGEKLKTYLVNIDLADKLEAIAYWDRKTTKEVIGEAMAMYVGSYEKKNGAVKTPPKK